jgi:hypothetical protein
MAKLFISRPCKKRAEDQLKLSRHRLRMVVVFLTGHAPVRLHLRVTGLFDRDPTCRSCRMDTKQCSTITCCCEVLARQRYTVFGKLFAEPKAVSTAALRGLH